jgi:ssDNA-binding Zn-finger/Zn-ribbon topoisomerase 1
MRSIGVLERSGAGMPTDTRYDASDISCPKCGKVMRVVIIEPASLVQEADEVTCRCGACNHEEKQIRNADSRDAKCRHRDAFGGVDPNASAAIGEAR